MMKLKLGLKNSLFACCGILLGATAGHAQCYNGYCPPPAPCGIPGYPPCGGSRMMSPGEADMILTSASQYLYQVSEAQNWIRNMLNGSVYNGGTCTAIGAVALKHRLNSNLSLGPIEAMQIRRCMIQSLAVAATHLQEVPFDLREQASREFLDVVSSLKHDDDLNFLARAEGDSIDTYRTKLNQQIDAFANTCLSLSEDPSVDEWRRRNFAQVVYDFSQRLLTPSPECTNGMPYGMPAPYGTASNCTYFSQPLVQQEVLQGYFDRARLVLGY
jgi:hypothetical protein